MYPLYVMENCTACGVCAKVCPNNAIIVDVEVKPDGRRFLKSYSIDYSKCDSCMRCVERCRRGSIVGVDSEKPNGVYGLNDLVKLKRELGIRCGKKSSFVDECMGCLTCVTMCPLNAIRCEDSDGFRHIEVDWNRCEGCGMCVRNCPNQALGLVEV